MTRSRGERAVLISGSPSQNSRSRTLLETARSPLEAAGFDVGLVDLSALPADALLGRRTDAAVQRSVELAVGARVAIVGSPVYRATYSGLLKVFFDLLPAEALDGTIAIPVLTGGGPGHQLALEHGLRPLLASVGAVVVATGVYAAEAQFEAGGPAPAVRQRLDHAVREAVALARALRGADRAPVEPVPATRPR